MECSPGVVPAESATSRPAASHSSSAALILGAPGIVQADEQNGRHSGADRWVADRSVRGGAFVAGHHQLGGVGGGHVGVERRAVADDPAMGDVVRQMLRELLPAVAEALTPPDGANASVLGASADELRSFALDDLTRRLNIIGVPLDTL